MLHRLLIPVVSGGLLFPLAAVRAQDDEVLVVAAKVLAGPAGATVVPIDDSRPTSDELSDWLETVAGASVRRLGGLGAWSGVSLRGSSFRQVTVMLDGVPLNPDGVDAVNLAELPVAALAALHVFRGRVPAIYGASPIGGVVDVVTRPTSAPPRLAVSGGSYGSARLAVSGGGTGRVGTAPMSGFATADLLTSAGDYAYLDDRGTTFVTDDDTVQRRQNADRAQLAALGRWQVGGYRLRWTLLDALVVRDEGVPGPIGAPTPDTSLRTTRNLLVSRWSGHTGAVGGAGYLWHLGRIEVLDARQVELGGAGAWQRDGTHTVGGAGQFSAALLPWLGLGSSARAHWSTFQRVPLATGVPSPAAQRWVVGAAADLRFTALRGALVVVPGVDVAGLLPRDTPEGAVWAVNPGLVVEGHPGAGVVLTATGGRAFRPPDMTELYGDRGALIGNAALRPEHAWQGDLGVRWDGGEVVHAGVEAAGFARRIDDRITWIQNAQRTLVPVNFGAALVAGGELAVSTVVPEWAEARLNLSVTHSENLSDDPAERGQPLPFVPVLALDHLLAVGWGNRVRLGWTLHVTDGTTTDAAGVHRQAARVLHGLSLRTQPGPAWPALDVDVRNVGNARTAIVPRDPIGADDGTIRQPITDFTGYPLPGTSVVVTLSWTPRGSP